MTRYPFPPVLHPMLPVARRAALGLALILLAACSPDDADITYVVVTSTPDPMATATGIPVGDSVAIAQSAPTFTPIPTLTPTAPPSPTPDMAPLDALTLAESQAASGYHEAAFGTFDGVLNNSAASGDLQAGAAFGAGRAALRAGLFSEAITAFTRLITGFPDDARAHQAYFLRADAYLGLSRWTEAINDYREYLRLRPGIIDSYVHERIGDAFLAIGMLPDALTSYQRATEGGRGLEPALALRERLAQVYLSSGDLAAAIAQYDAILEAAQNAPYRSGIDLRAAQALLNAGEAEAGLARMQRVFNTYPEQPAALEAMRALEAAGRPLNGLQKGRVLYTQGDYAGAITAFNDYSSTVPATEIPAEMVLLLGRAYREVGNAPAALVAFRTVVDQYPTDPAFGDALLEQGRTRFLGGDLPDAIAFYLQIAETYPGLTETAAEALWRAGYLYGQQEQFAESRAVFLDLAARFPNTTQARSGLGIAAAAALNLGDSAGAEALFRQLAEGSTGDTAANAWLQAGRLALERGDGAAAQAAFTQAGGAAPDSFFSARAADILSSRAPFTPPAAYRFSFDEAAQLAEAEAWLRTTFALSAPAEAALWPLSDALRADARLIRGTELWTMGAFDAAETEFYEVLEAYRADALASYQMALYFQGLGAHTPSQVGAANIVTASRQATLAVPPFIARLRYPAPYRDEVARVAGQYGIDPLLFYALIRHESLFDPNATAAAGEKGLMQVIPDTAAYIADALDWPNYENSDLFRPYVAIEFGGFYLAEQLERFEGNVYAGLAAYNAGPGRAIDWLRLAGDDPDSFMNTITIESTRLYIQLIYRNYAIYRALYGG